jgi:hypothetical protein
MPHPVRTIAQTATTNQKNVFIEWLQIPVRVQAFHRASPRPAA